MRKIKLEKISGIVALTYLVLIPAGAFFIWKKIQIIDQDVTEMWAKQGMPSTEHKPILNLTKLMKGLQGRGENL